jgi:sterol desaturase/sphingolipid hydroxylase (fatty acid hydroxylase superfamily)
MKRFVQAILWPSLVAAPLFLTLVLQAYYSPMIAFNMSYFALALTVLTLERFIPFEKSWHKNDGQMFPDFMHTITSKGFVQVIFILYLNDIVQAEGAAFWAEYSLFTKVTLALIIAEFGLYWAHRIAHEWRAVWHFHAVHHSVSRLWFFNTGRFHFIDSLISIVFSFVLMILLGFSQEMIYWTSVFTAFVGILTHTNIDSRSGVLNYFFNTPELHRWHHQKNDTEGNSNYGENLMLWDIVFKSYYHDKNRRPPIAIGISDTVPKKYLTQLFYPFERIAAGDISTKKALEKKEKEKGAKARKEASL